MGLWASRNPMCYCIESFLYSSKHETEFLIPLLATLVLYRIQIGHRHLRLLHRNPHQPALNIVYLSITVDWGIPWHLSSSPYIHSFIPHVLCVLIYSHLPPWPCLPPYHHPLHTAVTLFQYLTQHSRYRDGTASACKWVNSQPPPHSLTICLIHMGIFNPRTDGRRRW